MENNHSEDFERIESLDGYLAAHFKGDEFDEEFHGEKLFPFRLGFYPSLKSRKYFGTELYKILSEYIDEYLDNVFKFGSFDNPDEATLLEDSLKRWLIENSKRENSNEEKFDIAETYRDYLKWSLGRYVSKITHQSRHGKTLSNSSKDCTRLMS